MLIMTISASSSFPPSHHLKPNPVFPAFTPTSTAAASSSNPTSTTTATNFNTVKIIARTRRRRRWAVSSSSSSSDNQTTVVTAPPTTTVLSSSADDESPSSVSHTAAAAEIVKNFYEGINSHDLASVEDLIADNCVYEDLIFPKPFVGRKAILEFFQKFIDSISTDLQFVIDDISDEDTSAVGVMWHLEWKGKHFPFSKGCSFYRLDVLNGKKQIIYGRDSVEPAIKPGEIALVAIRGVAWLLQRFPQLADQL